MVFSAKRYSPILDPNLEAEARAMLIEHYRPVYKDNTDGFIDTSMSTEPFAGRFLYLRSVVGADKFDSQSTILVSGFGMGSEMIMARQFGFGKVFGVETEQILVIATTRRLQHYSGMYPILYNGNTLPYADGSFDIVFSGHVIEHTNDPRTYLEEALRVLAPGGYLSLEFPHRYYRIELHTQLPSFEWLPRSVRNFVLRELTSDKSPLSENVKIRYNSIIDTNLQQISLGGIKHMQKIISYPFTMINRVRAAAGITRCVIRRN